MDQIHGKSNPIFLRRSYRMCCFFIDMIISFIKDIPSLLYCWLYGLHDCQKSQHHNYHNSISNLLKSELPKIDISTNTLLRSTKIWSVFTVSSCLFHHRRCCLYCGETDCCCIYRAAIMLYVFQMDVGQMLTFDISLLIEK